MIMEVFKVMACYWLDSIANTVDGWAHAEVVSGAQEAQVVFIILESPFYQPSILLHVIKGHIVNINEDIRRQVIFNIGGTPVHWYNASFQGMPDLLCHIRALLRVFPSEEEPMMSEGLHLLHLITVFSGTEELGVVGAFAIRVHMDVFHKGFQQAQPQLCTVGDDSGHSTVTLHQIHRFRLAFFEARSQLRLA